MGIALQVVIVLALAGLAALGGIQRMGWLLAGIVLVCGAVAMGLSKTPEESARTAHSPKVSFVAPSKGYTASDGRAVKEEDIDLLARVFSMGPLHHAMTGTGAVAIAAAVAPIL